MENRPDSSLAGPPSDKISAGDRKAFSMNCPFLALLDSVTPFLVPTRREHGRRHREARPSSAVSAGSVELRPPQADFMASTSGQITLYFKPERAEPPESSQPSDGGCRGVSLVFEFASHGNWETFFPSLVAPTAAPTFMSLSECGSGFGIVSSGAFLKHCWFLLLSKTIFGGCSASRVRASALQASVPPRRACLPR